MEDINKSVKDIKKALRFEYKILFTFLISSVIGFSIINIVTILYMKNLIYAEIIQDVQVYKELGERGNQFYPYLNIVDNPEDFPDYKVIEQFEDKYIVLKKDYIAKRLWKFLLTLTLWEIILISILNILVYKVLSSSLKKEEKIIGILEVFILAFTHKLKNFLGTQKINVEILKMQYPDNKAIYRLEKAYILMEKDFDILIQTLKALRHFEEKIEDINIREIIEEIIKELESVYPEKSILIKLSNFNVKADRKDLKNILFVILENAFKYSNKNIFIVDKMEKDSYILRVENDIEFQKKGSGVGLEIAKFLAKKYNWNISVSTSNYRYKLILTINQ